MSKPKGKTLSLISGSNGKPDAVIAQRCCYCHRCNLVIANGEKCFDIPKIGRAFRNKERYCQKCFSEILEQTKKDLAILDSL